MSIFSEIRNSALIRELKQELNTDILLFGFDGSIYFGNLQRIEDGRIAFLSPAIEADSSNVEIFTPGGEFHEVAFLHVDLWQVVAKGTGIAFDPIYHPRAYAFPALSLQGNESTINVERQESHRLIHLLKRMLGNEVAITTLGGFLFEGILSDIDDELAIIAVEEIFGPGTSTSISDGAVRSIVVNLEALTSVSSTATS